MQKFTQTDYNELVGALDEALGVFLRQQKTEIEAEAALKDFIDGHYFKVWRSINA